MFSIIIPTYNCENYIEECMKGILAQTYRNYEVIVVDDGSSDNSLAIVGEMAQKKSNIRIVPNAHGGVCKARNTGLELAQGKYICFIDADDIVYNDYLELLAKAIAVHSPDVVYFYARYGIGNKLYSPDHVPENKLLEKEDLEYLSTASLYHVPELHDPESRLYGISSFSAWGQIYRRELYMQNHIRFTEGITLSEDGLVNLQMLKYAKKGVVIPVELYNYRTDNISATRSYKSDMIEMFTRRDHAVKCVIETLYPEKKDTYLEKYYCSLFYELRMISEKCIFHPQNKNSFLKKRRQFLELINRSDYDCAVVNCQNSYLRSEDRAYYVYAKNKSPLSVLLCVKRKQLTGAIHRATKLFLKKLQLYALLRRILNR